MVALAEKFFWAKRISSLAYARKATGPRQKQMNKINELKREPTSMEKIS